MTLLVFTKKGDSFKAYKFLYIMKTWYGGFFFSLMKVIRLSRNRLILFPVSPAYILLFTWDSSMWVPVVRQGFPGQNLVGSIANSAFC